MTFENIKIKCIKFMNLFIPLFIAIMLFIALMGMLIDLSNPFSWHEEVWLFIRSVSVTLSFTVSLLYVLIDK